MNPLELTLLILCGILTALTFLWLIIDCIEERYRRKKIHEQNRKFAEQGIPMYIDPYSDD